MLTVFLCFVVVFLGGWLVVVVVVVVGLRPGMGSGGQGIGHGAEGETASK